MGGGGDGKIPALGKELELQKNCESYGNDGNRDFQCRYLTPIGTGLLSIPSILTEI